MRLVLLTLLDRAVVPIEVLELREPLDPLRREVAVGHRMAHRDHLLAGPLQGGGDRAGRLRLPDAGADGGHGHGGDGGFSIVASGPSKRKFAPGRERLARLVHHVLVRDVGVGEHHVVHLELADQA